MAAVHRPEHGNASVFTLEAEYPNSQLTTTVRPVIVVIRVGVTSPYDSCAETPALQLSRIVDDDHWKAIGCPLHPALLCKNFTPTGRAFSGPSHPSKVQTPNSGQINQDGKSANEHKYRLEHYGFAQYDVFAVPIF